MSTPETETLTFSDLLAERLSRRDLLRAGAVAAGAAVLTPLLGAPGWASPFRLADSDNMACGSGAGGGKAHRPFNPIPTSTGDEVVVPEGFRASPLIRWGDPLRPGLPAFDIAAQTPEGAEQRFGYNCDYVQFFPLPRTAACAHRGLLWVNHEYTEEKLMFAGWSAGTATAEQVAIALASHGGTVVEITRRSDGTWAYDPASRYNRRITATTPCRLTGPAAGHPWLRTSADPEGRTVLGMLNNCGGGFTPWGTVLTAEENFDQYFTNPNALAAGPVRDAHLAYFSSSENRGWQKYHSRFDMAQEPHEAFRFGWVVEIDPYDPRSTPKKRTALGRMKHEASVTTFSTDRRVVVYTGDDQVFQHAYKFVSTGRATKLASAGDLLDDGTLYAARFNADGTGQWLPLRFGEGPLVEPAFTSQADVLIRTRQAAKALGATPMDRPEDIEVSPTTGRVYLAMTNNSGRTLANNDPANPRPANTFGHVIELIEDGDDNAALTFRWEVFLLCGRPENLVADLPANIDGLTGTTSYFAGYSDAAGLSPIAAPDNLLFDRAGNLWIATDGQPSSSRLSVNDALHFVPTDGPERGRVQQFLSGVKGAEVTGPCLSPAEDALFVSIQHPGENGTFAAPQSNWPDGAPNQPRPSVVVVTRDDGGPIPPQ